MRRARAFGGASPERRAGRGGGCGGRARVLAALDRRAAPRRFSSPRVLTAGSLLFLRLPRAEAAPRRWDPCGVCCRAKVAQQLDGGKLRLACCGRRLPGRKSSPSVPAVQVSRSDLRVKSRREGDFGGSLRQLVLPEVASVTKGSSNLAVCTFCNVCSTINRQVKKRAGTNTRDSIAEIKQRAVSSALCLSKRVV